MIVEMKKAYIVVQQDHKREMLKGLRKGGLLHLESDLVPTEAGQSLARRADAITAIVTTIKDLLGKQALPVQKNLSQEACKEAVDNYQRLLEERKEGELELHGYAQQIELLSPWGDFDPTQIRDLAQEGIDLHFYTIGAKDLGALDAAVSYIRLAPVGQREAIAVIGEQLGPTVPATRLSIGDHGLNELRALSEKTGKRLEKIEQTLLKGAAYVDCLGQYRERLVMAQTFEEVAASVEGEEALCWISGYLPVDAVPSFEALAKEGSWAYLLNDVDESDTPPTLVRYRKGVGIIKPVFDILGTVPGYTEGDISMWFLLFFTLFFAMIIGDAGYGVIFLLAAAALHLKAKKPTTIVLLIYVLATATIIWGSLTGTWFGSLAVLQRLPFLQKLVIPSIANYPELFGLDATTAQNTVMKFCFIIGTVQLSLACALNVIKKAPHKDLSLVADIGWLVSILALYFVVLQLVIGAATNLVMVFSIVGIGFVLVILFGQQGPSVPFGKGLLAGLGGIFTTFLDTISAFSNIMSYIRLFAVGMASVAIAQSFNTMAASLGSGPAVIAGIAVLVIGHSLNLIMGLLSVVVHGVRLNLLEFSGQLGMEWTGVAYKPFAQTVEEQ